MSWGRQWQGTKGLTKLRRRDHRNIVELVRAPSREPWSLGTLFELRFEIAYLSIGHELRINAVSCNKA